MLPPDFPISVAWACVSNVDRQETFSACLTLRNTGSATIAPGWAVCFNTCRKIVAGSASEGFSIDHVNGGLVRLCAAADAGPWHPGEVLRIAYQGHYWTISATDAPLG